MADAVREVISNVIKIYVDNRPFDYGDNYRINQILVNLRTLVLAEIEKLPTYHLPPEESDKLLYRAGVVQALTKLFEGRKGEMR